MLLCNGLSNGGLGMKVEVGWVEVIVLRMEDLNMDLGKSRLEEEV